MRQLLKSRGTSLIPFAVLSSTNSAILVARSSLPTLRRLFRFLFQIQRLESVWRPLSPHPRGALKSRGASLVGLVVEEMRRLVLVLRLALSLALHQALRQAPVCLQRSQREAVHVAAIIVRGLT